MTSSGSSLPSPSRSGAARWRRTLIPAALIAAAGTVVVLIASMPAQSLQVTPTPIPPVNVTVQTVRPLPELADTFEITGVVEPYRVVRVAAEVAGRIERYGRRPAEVASAGGPAPAEDVAEEGRPVRQGDPLLYLNRDLLEARRDRAAAQYAFDEREFRRVQDLFERGTTSRQELDDARTRRDISKAALDEITHELERTDIVAPISGFLNRLPLEPGEYAAPGDCVAEIVELDRVKVVVDVPERDAPLVRAGHSAAIVPLGRGADEVSGTVTYVDATAHALTRTTRVEITVDNADQRLRSGQIVRVRLTRRVLTDQILIPLAAVLPLEQGRVVYVVEGGRAARRDVELGFIQGRSVQVTCGLRGGELLVVEGQRYVNPDQAVNIVAVDGAPVGAAARSNGGDPGPGVPGAKERTQP